MIFSFVTGKSNPPSKFAILEAASLSSALYDITLTYSRFITPDVAFKFSILTSMFGDTDQSPNLLSYENMVGKRELFPYLERSQL